VVQLDDGPSPKRQRLALELTRDADLSDLLPPSQPVASATPPLAAAPTAPGLFASPDVSWQQAGQAAFSFPSPLTSFDLGNFDLRV
jgi:hypothetical protein